MASNQSRVVRPDANPPGFSGVRRTGVGNAGPPSDWLMAGLRGHGWGRRLPLAVS